jgi:hypothetical protein
VEVFPVRLQPGERGVLEQEAVADSVLSQGVSGEEGISLWR